MQLLVFTLTFLELGRAAIRLVQFVDRKNVGMERDIRLAAFAYFLSTPRTVHLLFS